MPLLTNAVPKYRHHRASGQAVVTIAGKEHYLGPWRSKASRAEYDRLIGEWLAAGRPSREIAPDADLTVAEVGAALLAVRQGVLRQERQADRRASVPVQKGPARPPARSQNSAGRERLLRSPMPSRRLAPRRPPEGRAAEPQQPARSASVEPISRSLRESCTAASQRSGSFKISRRNIPRGELLQRAAVRAQARCHSARSVSACGGSAGPGGASGLWHRRRSSALTAGAARRTSCASS